MVIQRELVGMSTIPEFRFDCQCSPSEMLHVIYPCSVYHIPSSHLKGILGWVLPDGTYSITVG